MTLKEAQQYFQKKLSDLYSTDEINHLFNVLAEHYCGLSKLQVILQQKSDIEQIMLDKFIQASERLYVHEPIEYIIKTANFYGYNFIVSPAVLIPRPETEEMLKYIEENFSQNISKDFSILDVGTGSACIAISLKKIFPKAKVVATDISEEALQIAKQNADLHQAEITFEQLDMHDSPLLWFEKKFDIIVSNPPYVLKSELQEMSERVKLYEPHLALFTPENDDIFYYKSLSNYFQKCLKANGKWIVEVNDLLAEEIATYYKSLAYQEVEIILDVYGRKRFIKGSK